MPSIEFLPEPYASAEFGAHTEYGRRMITMSLREPGNLHRCSYWIAWFDIAEREPWRGEPLWVHASRRVEERSMRTPFTDRARESISAELLPPVSRYGFSRWWVELHRAKFANPR